MGNVEIPNWLKGLPLAPEFRPTDTEFADPIAYISKIEKEASAFGICKVVPPFPKPSKKYVFSNLNKSLSKSPELGLTEHGSSSKVGSTDNNSDGEIRAVFTTRQQELGQSVKRSKGVVQNSSSGVHKQVWQSGQIYTLEQFESKSRAFTKTQLGTIKEVSPLVIEALFWKSASEKPIYLEYANDVPGSGFGEPEGQCRYFHKRRRKRNFFTRSGEVDGERIDNISNDDNKGDFPRKELTTSLGVSKSPVSPPTLVLDEASQSSKKKSQSSCYDKEGSAGWKMSNCPWNLQVISRSPGSLTRFMPDDIPGVTSPMVYIGMLYSWFAWHVEDHELHSMNFLHTGSSKTWYSVPGDYAFAFEDVVRTEAYGANIDRTAALALLGEKTTLMSPEVVVASGIPCCRLVQNPGEFVVTFPRAYHVGFSHGFNCGEAANFGTPQWLSVAKEAAVRRAAMNYLPMLSHQQLLYLLTMSFVSRVPRSFLPGVRSSRLRDRQKEERELLVKKEFIKDILHDNSVLSVLLGKNSSYQAVLWNQDLLTHPYKETVSPVIGDNADNLPTEKSSHVDPNNKCSNEHTYLLEEMSFYMENLNDLYLGSDDLWCDFQVDSGTLACVACGILGFPFMSVVQPSEKASLELVQECPGTSGYLKPCSSANHDATNNEGPLLFSNSVSLVNRQLPSTIASKNGWNVQNKFLRPRSFCLEHAVEIVELLKCKGGANVLVICHSDYQKIKAHATTIADEIDIPFNYQEVPLDMASREDLNLIDLAIEDGQHKESGEDWTSKLGINLWHCVKIGKNSASKQVRDALTLGGLLSRKCPGSDFSTIKWKLRRSRSRKIYFPPLNLKPRDTTESKNDIPLERESLVVNKEVKQLIQYSRRNLKTKQGDCEQSKIGQSLKVSVGSTEIHGSEETNADSEAYCLVTLADSEILTEHNAVPQEVDNSFVHCTEDCNVATEGNSKVDENVLASSCHYPGDECFGVETSDMVIENVCMGEHDRVRDLVSGNNVENPDPCTAVVEDQTVALMEEFSEGTKQTSSAKESSCGKSLEVQPEVGLTGVGNSEELASSTVTHMEVDNPCVSEQECSVQRVNLPQPNVVDDTISGDCSPRATKTGNESMPVEMKKSAKEHSGNDLTSDDKIEAKQVQTEEETVSVTEITFQKYSRVRRELDKNRSNPAEKSSNDRKRKRNRELERVTENEFIHNGFIRSPCEGLRPRLSGKDAMIATAIQQEVEEKPKTKTKIPSDPRAPSKGSNKKEKHPKAHKCDIESCHMSFDTKAELSLHKHNCCPHNGCRKRFSSHKYAMIHHRVHEDDRPLKCPWKGCSMSFKWAWARTEHIRVHTGEKPYKCKVEGCGLAFRFVSDYSRHRRKTGHYVN